VLLYPRQREPETTITCPLSMILWAKRHCQMLEWKRSLSRVTIKGLLTTTTTTITTTMATYTMETSTHHLRPWRTFLPSFVVGNGPTEEAAASTTASHSVLCMDSSSSSLGGMMTIAPTPQMADSILAASLNQMSLQEREKVYEDVHGVAPPSNPEEPTFVASCLAELQTELDAIPPLLKVAYDLAYSQHSLYVTHSKFRLLFLRSESFQPKAAASKMVGFLEAKLELFGPDKVSRDILLSDYDPSDIKCLESGLYQLLPGRDRSGRPVIFCSGVAHRNTTVVNRVRGESVTRGGKCVCVFYCIVARPFKSVFVPCCLLCFSFFP
jgi:hypothetical protein